ncbi:hypothetical protein L204_104503 [Cryptococcus depauperatus]|nr:nuclear movement protein nudC [Cryptococcus depauperatus CBS 7855]
MSVNQSLSKQEKEANELAQRKKEEEEQAKLPYKWTQELDNATISLPLPKGTKGKNLTVDIQRRKLKVQLKEDKEPLISGDLFDDIVAEDSSWTIDDNVLTIELEKYSSRIGKPRWWPHIYTHHPQIDTTKIVPEPTTSLSDLDQETRGMVEKMMFDNRQKALGQPTSDELKKQEGIQRFMKQHPEMDFSNAKIG